MKHLSWLKLLEGRVGEGPPANKGDRVVCNSRLFLNKGDEVLLNPKLAEYIPNEMFRVEGGITFDDHTAVYGSRQVIVGIEHALMGMKVVGYRKFRVSLHLAYRDKGIPDLIP